MVHRKISGDMKERALYLLMEAGWESIAEALGVPAPRSIRRWEDYTTHGCVKPSQSIIGRPKLLTPDTIENIQELLREDPTFLLDEIKEWLVFQLRPCT